MDLNRVQEFHAPSGAEAAAMAGRLGAGDAWLAGGTWLFSEPQPHLRRLVDLTSAGWTPLRADAQGLEIAATCTIAELDALQPPADWRAAWLIGRCARSFLASFKIWNVATVGGNLCMALPAGPMISLAAALDAECEVIGAGAAPARAEQARAEQARADQDGAGEGGAAESAGGHAVRRVPALSFVLGPQRTALREGELLRAIRIPAEALSRRAAFRRASLAPMGRTGAIVIGTRDGAGIVHLTFSGGTARPVRIAAPAGTGAAALTAMIDAAIPAELWFDDIHGAPAWRRAISHDFAAQILAELSEDLS